MDTQEILARQPAPLGARIRWVPAVRGFVEGQVIQHAEWDEPAGTPRGHVMLVKSDAGRTVCVPVASPDWALIEG